SNGARRDPAILQGHFCGSACGDNTVYFYKNSGGGALALASSVSGFGSAGGELFVTDLNGDQNMDIIDLNGDHFGGSTTYALGKANFTFGTQFTIRSDNVSDLVARDLNLDSRHDVAISSSYVGRWAA